MGRFKPKEGECYYAVFEYQHWDGTEYHTQMRVWENSYQNEHDYNTNSCFKTENEAEECRDLRQMINNSKLEVDEIDEKAEAKWIVCFSYDKRDDRIKMNDYFFETYNTDYFSLSTAKYIIDFFGEEDLKKYYFGVNEE